MDRYLSEGKKVVGCFPPFVPEELVHACGMIPMGMWGGRTPLKRAGEYLPAFACSLMQADMEFALSGVYDGMSAVIIPAICDTLRCMTQNWRFGVTHIPMIPIVWPQNREAPESLDYLISEYALRPVFGEYFVRTYGEDVFLDWVLAPSKSKALTGKTVDEIVDDWCADMDIPENDRKGGLL